jgi:outer membrane receptor protein involved in Fe transport
MITGLTLHTFWNKNLYSNTTLSAVRSLYDTKVVEKPGDDLQFKNKSYEDEYTFKTDFVFQASKDIELNFGASYKSVHFDHNIYISADTIFQYIPSTKIAVDTFRTFPARIVNKDLSSFKGSLYSQLSVDFLSRFRATAGLRYDYFDYIEFQSLSPRLGLSYFFNPVTTLNIAYGVQYQSPAYIQLTAHSNNINLDSYYTEQYVAGLEYLFRADIKMVIETYYKKYHDVPIGISNLTPEPYDRSAGKAVNAGIGYARGIELFFQKKLNNGFSAIFSYAYSISKAKDLRFNKYYNWDYDYRNVMTFITGYKFKFHKKEWYQKIKHKWWFEFFNWLPIGLSDEYEISVKYRYLGGRPYTPPVYYPELRYWNHEEDQLFNTARYPIYGRLDLRIDRRFIFNTWSFVFFLDFWNVLGRDNIWGYQYDSDGSRDEVLQFQAMPIVGISFEF